MFLPKDLHFNKVSYFATQSVYIIAIVGTNHVDHTS